MKNFLIFIAILAILVVAGNMAINYVKNEDTGRAVVPTTNTLTQAPTTDLYFWSQTCPHCAKVNEFMQSWDGKDKITLNKLEVSENTDNANQFLNWGTQFCKVPRNQLGVPLLVTTEGQCLIGDEPIIDYFKNLEL